MILTRQISVLSEGHFYSAIITDQIRDIVTESGVREGAALIFYQHTTGSVMIVEHEAGILVDLEDLFEEIVPGGGDFKHHIRGYDTNGAAHLRSILLGTSIHVPILDGTLRLGSFQEVMVLDMDPARRERTVLVQVIGE
jgi:secondary thiamine-phosphate synthase enzyme